MQRRCLHCSTCSDDGKMSEDRQRIDRKAWQSRRALDRFGLALAAFLRAACLPRVISSRVSTDKWDEFFMSFCAQRRMKMGLGWEVVHA
jgi:hypothetical protein